MCVKFGFVNIFVLICIQIIYDNYIVLFVIFWVLKVCGKILLFLEDLIEIMNGMYDFIFWIVENVVFKYFINFIDK